MKKSLIAGLLAAPLLALAGPVSLLQDGSFENAGGAAMQGWGGYTYGNGYSPDLPGWTVDSGSVDIVLNGTAWGNAFSGNDAVDLNGWGPGVLSQTFDTTAGQSYLVSFAYSRNPMMSAAEIASATVQAGSTVLDVSAPDNASEFGGAYGVKWLQDSFEFTATGDESTLTFTSTNGGNAGVFLDDVAVTAAVPEPATLALVLGGVGALFLTRRRRR